MRNLEFKARFDDLALASRRASAMGARSSGHWRETDTYFNVSHGRLKLRQTDIQQAGTLIYYERPDEAHSRFSEYHLVRVDYPEEFRFVLSAALGVSAVVSKKRALFTYVNTRIHLDSVDRLGCFVELETVVQNQSEVAVRAEHDRIKQALGLDECEVVPISYGDLVKR